MAELQFNSANVEPQQSFDPIPKGWYDLMIEQVELKPTKAGTGSYLSLQLKVQGGEFNNRTVFDMITYSNPNAQAVEIGHRKLSALCRAVGIVELKSTDMLENRIVAGKVGIKVDKTGEYDPSNDVREYKSAAAATAPVTGNVASNTQTAANTVAGAGAASAGAAPGEEDDADAPWNQ
uniref:Single strand DNA binding protein n=2 Tax=unclassified Rosemountvirus TaxID=2738372 RepID=A0AAU8GG14_9CAUD